ncbi:MAG: DUF937 domain-containing protein [Melioribacteraceae bacterium]|nr:DUF937 domain-containing protein [Melioribacteraceae bacterium]
MSNLLEEFMGSVGSQVTGQLSSNLGIDNKTANAIIPQVLPMILGGLKKQKDERGGADRVDHILNKYGSSSVLDDIGGLFSTKSQDPNPDPALGGLLGDAGLQATNLFGKQFNLDSGTAAKIIPMLAPVILGFLTKKRDTGTGSSGIASLLDQDGDGSVLDDVAGFLMSGLAGSSTQKKGGLLGGLLGGLFGSKK